MSQIAISDLSLGIQCVYDDCAWCFEVLIICGMIPLLRYQIDTMVREASTCSKEANDMKPWQTCKINLRSQPQNSIRTDAQDRDEGAMMVNSCQSRLVMETEWAD